ncbi:MAG TPA: carbohydrate-binding domain-containing protein [Ruminococcus sp.]|nr:carbohydrate-binding domain-containing protein [Ruminococcus sp.]
MKNLKITKKTLAFITSAVMCTMSSAGCSASDLMKKTEDTSSSVASESSETSSTADTLSNTIKEEKKEDNGLFSARDLDPSYDELTATITLDGDSAKVDGNGAKSEGSVVTITEEGVYRITGSLDDGQIVVDADKAKVQLVLDNADITCSDSSAIYGKDSDKIFITLAEGSKNTVSDGKTYADSESEDAPTAAIFSQDSITINGSGSLTVNGNYKNGIQSKDDIVITGGNITVESTGDGIKGKDYVAVADGEITINAGEDGIKSTNATDEGMGFVYIEDGKFDITAGNDGIQAETVLTVNDGTFEITTGGGYEKSTKTHSDSFGGGFGGGHHDMFGGEDFGGSFGEDEFGDFSFDDFDFEDFNFDDFGGGSPFDGNGQDDFGDNFRSGVKSGSEANNLANITHADTTSTDETSDSTKGLKAGTSIIINGGTFTIDSADDSIHSNGDTDIFGGIFTLKSGDDGIHSEGTLNIGEKAENSFDTVQIFIAECYEGIEGVTINQNSGTVYIISGDDGYNAAGGALDTTTENNNFRGGMMSTSTGTLNINGGLAVVNSANGDHDAFDSNGDVNLNGGYICANGQEPIDCGDSGNTINYNGTSIITMTAGNTDLTQRYSFADEDGNVIVSFMSANGSAGQNCTDCKAYSGGTVTDGKETVSQADEYAVTVGGTLKDGNEITAEAETGGMMGFGGGRKGRGNIDAGMTPPDGERELPTDENGEAVMPEIPNGGFGGENMTPPQGGRGGPHGERQTPTDDTAE